MRASLVEVRQPWDGEGTSDIPEGAQAAYDAWSGQGPLMREGTAHTAV